MSNPWDVPAKETVGDTNPERIYSAVGNALSRWEEVEGALGDLYSGIVFPTDKWSSQIPPAVRAYGSIVGARARIDMIVAAATEFFSQRNPEQLKKFPELQERTKALLNKVAQLSNRRNDIAHGIAMMQVVDDDVVNGYFLYPGLYASKKWKGGGFTGGEPAYAYTAAQIEKFAEHFDELQNQISVFPDAIFLMQKA